MARSLLLSLLLGATLLTACAPSQGRAGEAHATIAILNAPTQSRLAGVADLVQDDLTKRADAPFDFVSAFTLRFLETHNDMFHSRAAPSAGRIARSHGADLAVMVSAGVLEREVTETGKGDTRRVDVSLALEAQVVDPRNDSVVQVLRTRTHKGSRVESVSLPLPDTHADPTALALSERAAPELALSR